MTTPSHTSTVTLPLPQDDAWDVKRAAPFLGVSVKTLYRMAAEGTVPHFKLGGALRFSPTRLAEWRQSLEHGGATR